MNVHSHKRREYGCTMAPLKPPRPSHLRPDELPLQMKCSPEVVGGYFGVSPFVVHGRAATGAS
jgi:hypothetical protein